MSGDNLLSLHSQILADLQQNIFSGRWSPGTKIPSEYTLMAQYGCSRMTVNKAVTELVRRKLIVRRRKAGSIVLQQRSQNAILEIFDVRDEVLAMGEAYRFSLIDRFERAADMQERRRFGLGSGRSVVALRGVHWAGGRPFCLEERIINLAVVPEAAFERFENQPPGAWLLEHVPWSEATHRILAEAAAGESAAALMVPLGSPLLLVERMTWKLNEPVTHVRFSYPGGLHTLEAHFTPRTPNVGSAEPSG